MFAMNDDRPLFFWGGGDLNMTNKYKKTVNVGLSPYPRNSHHQDDEATGIQTETLPFLWGQSNVTRRMWSLLLILWRFFGSKFAPYLLLFPFFWDAKKQR